jgi:hypothetical protein
MPISKRKLPQEVIDAMERDPDRNSKGHWRKGVSGNPDGRPGSDRLRAILSEWEEPMVRRIIELALEGKDYVALKAIQVAWLYMYGKPRDSLDQDLMHTVEKVNALIRNKSGRSGSHAGDRQGPKGVTQAPLQ